jgi:hypothetical protein
MWRKVSDFLVVELLLMSAVITPPAVSILKITVSRQG